MRYLCGEKYQEIQGQRECIHPHHQQNKVQRSANTNNVLVVLVSASGESWKNASLQVSLHFFFPNFHLSCSTRSLSRSFVLLTTSFSFPLRKLNIASRKSCEIRMRFYYHLTRIYIIFLYYLQGTHHTRPSFVFFFSVASCS